MQAPQFFFSEACLIHWLGNLGGDYKCLSPSVYHIYYLLSCPNVQMFLAILYTLGVQSKNLNKDFFAVAVFFSKKYFRDFRVC